MSEVMKLALEEAYARIGELEELLDENFQKHCEDVLNSIEAEMRTRLAAKDARIAELETALRPFANEPLSTEPAHMKTRLWSFEDSDARIQAARDALEG